MATVHPETIDDDVKEKPLGDDEISEGDTDDEDDARAPEVEYKDMAGVSGYEGASFKKEVVQKPPPAKDLYGEKPDMPFKECSQISEDEVREHLLKFVNQNCCWGSGPAKSMTMDSIRPLTAFHYVLETYSEARKTKYVHKPYPGGHVDGPNCGIAPGAWDVPCKPDNIFKNQTVLIQVPHTQVIKDCARCECFGKVECGRCHGHGRVRCYRCAGSKTVLIRSKNGMRSRRCGTCSGTGKSKCRRCLGEGKVTCPKCEGCKFLRVYIQLEVKFTNYRSEYMLEMTALPDHLIKDVGGDRVFEQELDRVWPLSSYPVAEINDNSARLIKKHKDDYSDQRCLKQRHHLRAVPVTEVDYTYDGQKNEFWIYGLERRVHFDNYPSTCCWGCTVL